MYTLKHLLLFTVQSKAGCVRAGKMFLVSVSLACLKIRMCHIKFAQIQQKKTPKKQTTVFSLRENKQARWQVRVRVHMKCLTGGEAGWCCPTPEQVPPAELQPGARTRLQGPLGDGAASGSAHSSSCVTIRKSAWASVTGLLAAVLSPSFPPWSSPWISSWRSPSGATESCYSLSCRGDEVRKVSVRISVCYTVKYLLLVLIKCLAVSC